MMSQQCLLCDFHIHTTASDGELSLKEIIDLYGQRGFDVIAITDHVMDSASLKTYREAGRRIPAVECEMFQEYLQSLWNASKQAWKMYRMLLLPGMEVTNDTQKFHMLGIDIKDYISPDQSVEQIIAQIHTQGGIAVACHPSQRGHTREQPSIHLWNNHDRFATLFDAWEVANRDDLFNVVGLKKFNYVANSDFHELRHVYSWKTLLFCEKNPEAIKQAIRENVGVSIYLYRKPAAD